ncbi:MULTISPECIES: RNA polymerase sigma factor [Sphingobacterium]|uniref:RNA polymerase sigma-70 factor (ECF subfamily) n=1 Tax=Sphingobacterium detergens TaxID=1145106 RepID=A0A420BKN1_SPHD1|nr:MULTISPECIES: RNA polymerase sigma-70 factor [Sphingobacterium]MCS4227007.1 RNA polymerase sigma-70 factor (ECF subfamily) [Sphingobacterium sp. BIGb0165]RKE57273.1 RNA polymerase sigma-70 factor (ECF subfamily) [Sphingobacterium detergens]
MGNADKHYFSWSEEELLSEIQRGDYAAFTEVYNRFAAKLYSFSQKIELDTADREDIIQEVFSALWVRREVIQIDNLGAWLYMSVRKQALYQLRKKKYRDNHIQSIINFVTPFYDPILGQIQEKELQHFLDRQLEKLPPRAQEVFRLSRQEHLTYKEIAEQLGISEKTVRKQVQNVLKIFRYKLGHKTIEGLVIIAYLYEKK